MTPMKIKQTTTLAMIRAMKPTDPTKGVVETEDNKKVVEDAIEAVKLDYF